MPAQRAQARLGGAPVDVSAPAVILAVHDHNGLAQVRSLGRLGVPVWILHPAGHLPATRSRYVAGRISWDAHAMGAQRTVEHLLGVVAPAVGGRAVLLPSDDESAVLIAEHAGELSAAFMTSAPPPELPGRLVDKLGLAELCRTAGVPGPATSAPGTWDELEAFLADAVFPVVVKARLGWRVRGMTDKVTYIVQDAAAARDAVRRLAVEDDLNVIVQEYLPGGADAVWVYHAYIDRTGEPRVARVGNKLREYPIDTGLTTFGVNRPNDEVRAAGDAIVRQTGYRGVVDLDFRRDPRDGAYKPLDFNPRPGANFRLFADDIGMDVVRAAYLDLTGQPLPEGRQIVGRKWVVEHWDLVAARNYVRAGRISPRAYLRSLRGVQETAWWAADDPVPFAAVLAEFCGTALRRGVRSVRRG
jgi:predicted ATP-grasp superfamily ATP-dependent carboligase